MPIAQKPRCMWFAKESNWLNSSFMQPTHISMSAWNCIFWKARTRRLTPNVVIQLLASFPDEALTSILFLADSPEDSFSGSVRIKDQCKKQENLRILLLNSPLSGSLEDRQLCVLPDSAVFCNAHMLLQDSIDHLAARVLQTWFEETSERIKQCLDRGDTPQAAGLSRTPLTSSPGPHCHWH